MKPYLFVIHSVPTPENRYYGKAGGAKVCVIAMEECAESALERAEAYIRRFQWEPRTVQETHELNPARIDGYPKAQAELCRKALAYGVSAVFFGYQVDDHPGDPVVVLRPN